MPACAVRMNRDGIPRYAEKEICAVNHRPAPRVASLAPVDTAIVLHLFDGVNVDGVNRLSGSVNESVQGYSARSLGQTHLTQILH